MPVLSELIPINIRFHEIDSLRIVWHGHYLKYFEDGREAFGRKYGIGYLDVYEIGMLTPLVNISCEYRKSIKYGDAVLLETTYLDSDAAKIQFQFKLFNPDTNDIYATGTSTQVFLTTEGELCLTIPRFFMDWKREWGVMG